MRDINEYANYLLLKFLDAAHEKIESALREEFGEDWFVEGVKKHLNSIRHHADSRNVGLANGRNRYGQDR